MRQKNQPAKSMIVCRFLRPESTEGQVDMVENHQEPRQLVILDPQRPGDRRQLARLLAAIAWRLAKEQAAQSVVESQEQQVA